MTLVTKVEAENFLFLLLISTLYLMGISNLLHRLEKLLGDQYHALSILLPVLTLSLDYFFFNGRSDFTIVTVQYLFTITSISMVEESLKIFQTKCLSPLAPEAEKEGVSVAEELGHVLSSLVLLFSGLASTPLIFAITCGMAFIILRKNLLIRLSFFSGNSQKTHSTDEISLKLANPLLLFLAVIGLIKVSYGLLLYEGYQQLQVTHQSVKDIYLFISIAQGLLIIVLVLIRSRFSWISNWIRKTKLYLWLQVSFLLVGTVFASPWVLIAAGSLRKSLGHTLLNSALLDLSLQLPSSFLNPIKRQAEFLSHTIGMVLIVSVGYVYYKIFHEDSILTTFIIIECIFATVALSAVGKRIINFHLQEIHSTDPGQALASCYGLKMQAMPKAVLPLIELLNSTKSTHLKRSIIQTLANYDHSDVPGAILREFNKLDREDLKVCSVEALNKIGSNEIRQQLLEGLELIPFEQQDFERFRWRLYLKISATGFEEAEKRLFRMIEEEKKDPNSRALANFMLVLTEIVRETGHDLSKDFKEFLAPHYSRRVRTNAASGLYLLRPRDAELNEFLKTLRTSTHIHDLNAWIFFQGEVMNYKVIKEIEIIALESKLSNTVALMALMKLSHSNSGEWLAAYFNHLEIEAAAELIHNLNFVRNQNARFEFYKNVLTKYPESIEKLLTVLTYSKRDFGDDFQKILLELKFLGIDTTKYSKLARFGHYR